MSAQDTKERILACTTELIKELNGNIDNVTIRTIADRAGVGVGLTNHYFKSKDCLIAECVDNAFSDLFAIFMPGREDILDRENVGPNEATKRVIAGLVEFMRKNEAMTRVALLMDAKNPTDRDYTGRIVNSLAYCMVDRRKLEEMLTNDKISEKMKQQFREHFVNEQKIKAFTIVSTLKEAFLRKDCMDTTIGLDLKNEEQRDEYLDELIEIIM